MVAHRVRVSLQPPKLQHRNPDPDSGQSLHLCARCMQTPSEAAADASAHLVAVCRCLLPRGHSRRAAKHGRHCCLTLCTRSTDESAEPHSAATPQTPQPAGIPLLCVRSRRQTVSSQQQLRARGAARHRTMAWKSWLLGLPATIADTQHGSRDEFTCVLQECHWEGKSAAHLLSHGS